MTRRLYSGKVRWVFPQHALVSLRKKQGAASALIVLLIVLLVFFGVLALVTAAADWRLAQKRADWTQDFYRADAVGEIFVADLTSFLSEQETSLTTDQLESFLLRRPEIGQIQIAEHASGYQLSGLVFDPENSKQGIEMALIIPSSPWTDRSSIDIIRWVQWQSPLPDEATEPSLWEGN